MTIRNLDKAFHPTSIAIIGASERPGSVGEKVLANVLAAGFEGPVWPVNLKYDTLKGIACYRDVGQLPGAPDLAIIATPAATVPSLIAQLGARGTRAVVVLSAGITDSNGLRQKMLDAARPHTLRIFGPNTIGLVLPSQKVDASFAHLFPLPGRLALLSQSGAIATTLIDWARARGIGFSHVISMGDMADVDFGDCLDMLARDREASAVLMYLETVTNARKFMSAARALSRIKPVVAVKSGRHAQSAKAAATHTGALAGEDGVFDAALERAGIVRVDTLENLFAAAQVLTRVPARAKARTAIVTNGGGAGVLALDALLDHGGNLAELSPDTLGMLDKLLPDAWSHANPVDILGDAPPERYAQVLRTVARDPGVDTVLALSCPTGLASTADSANVIAGMANNGMVEGKPLITSWLGDFTGAPARAILDAAGIASFETPAQAVNAISYLERRTEVGAALLRVPEVGSEDVRVDDPALAEILAQARREGRTMLLEDEAKQFLSRFGLAVPRSQFAETADSVGEKADCLLSEVDTVVVKLVSKAISHKSDIGGVVLGLRTREDCIAAANSISERLSQAHPGLVPDGFLIQEMVSIPHAREVLIGTHTDPIFGPAILFGAGGIAAETVGDTAMALPPLDDKLAGDLIGKTRISRVLGAYRNVPGANRTALIEALIEVSRLVATFPEIESMDINPLLVGTERAVALDARIVIRADFDHEKAADRLSLKPYPSGWDIRFDAQDGDSYDIRPIRPTDVSLFPTFFQKVTMEDIRMRFHVAKRDWPQDTLVRLTQIDYDREMAFVAIDTATGDLAGVSRLYSDPDREEAEYAIFVRSDLQGYGLGRALLDHLLTYARADGIGTVLGDVYAGNSKMLELCRELGFRMASRPDDGGVHRVSIRLR
ncbi:bifunctional acetate--CoA ligase family protein/GNAT family N-acetyltransferase [Pelagibacterium limicola]|uniref:bifunctional acetate--CoA ligase family protein/GNAT family N-acetyltransferase n=1 Tax=Pelagibacterium limicola TaxID=2791022 RepID=UPI0018AFD429|nr:bifunctional acetate--CoA ligase family protein/GNAT family N-acetyltransferase [Pelagibacterium limicola]